MHTLTHPSYLQARETIIRVSVVIFPQKPKCVCPPYIKESRYRQQGTVLSFNIGNIEPILIKKQR